MVPPPVPGGSPVARKERGVRADPYVSPLSHFRMSALISCG